MGIEKRTHVRFPARLRVAILHEGEALEAWSRDLSLGGMFLTCERALPYGTTFTAAIHFPALATPARIGCTVRWSVKGGMGVSFGALRASETWAINLLASQVMP